MDQGIQYDCQLCYIIRSRRIVYYQQCCQLHSFVQHSLFKVKQRKLQNQKFNVLFIIDKVDNHTHFIISAFLFLKSCMQKLQSQKFICAQTISILNLIIRSCIKKITLEEISCMESLMNSKLMRQTLQTYENESPKLAF